MFKFKDKTNIEMKTVALEEDFFIRAPIKTNQMSIQGVDGLKFDELGYDSVTASFSLQLLKNASKDDLLEWLSGIGVFEFGGRYTTMRMYDAITISRDAAVQIIQVNYIRDPFWYKDDTFTEVQSLITNTGNVSSNPLIRLAGDGTIDISINDVRFLYHFDEDKEVIIDCRSKTETYKNMSKSKNIEIGFEYPVLYPGENRVQIHSGNAKVFVKRKDAWL